ncbi:MAG: PAS domain S-box protein, partial [Burkholderiales bacterium]|nr:PAS domain S-box protein [Burkholderiales bacterium]
MNENILIVEDDAFMAEQLSLLLRKLGYRVAGIAASGESALAQAAQVRPDLIIMDSLLEGGVDGIEAAQRINETHPTPVLFLTAHDDEAFFQRAKNNQPYAFLLKPPSERELALAIELALYRHQVEQQQAQDALLRYRAALDNSADAIYLIDRESMRFVDMNETACDTLGYTREEMLGMGPQHIKPFFNRDMLAARFDEIIASGLDGVVQTEHQRKDGSRFPVEVKLRANEAGGRRLMVAIARDISDRVEAERTLRESEQRFRQLADNINEAFWIRDVASGNILYASPAYEKIFERSLESLYAHPRSFVGMVHADDRSRVSAFVERLYVNPGVDALEYRIVGKDGRVRWILTHAFPVTDENGKIYRIAGVSEEVTQRRESEEQYRTIVQGSMDGFWTVDVEGRCLDVNEAYCQLIGYTREVLLTMTISDIEAAETPEQTEAHMRRIIEIGYDRFETRHRHRNGHLIDVEVSANFVETTEGGRFY